MMKLIEGGVCAAQGFTASGIHCGIRKNREKRDLALIVSEKRASAAASSPAASAQRIIRNFLSFLLRLKRPKEFDFIFQLYPELVHDARAAHLREAENF